MITNPYDRDDYGYERWRSGQGFAARDPDEGRWHTSRQGSGRYYGRGYDYGHWRTGGAAYDREDDTDRSNYRRELYDWDYDAEQERSGTGYRGFSKRDYDDRWRYGPQDTMRDYGKPGGMYGERVSHSGQPWTYEARGPYTGCGPRSYQRSDERICEDVCEILTRHGQIDASDIEVNVNNGEVTLTGTVDSRAAKRMAEDVAEGVMGVTDVHNQLRV